MDLHGTFVLLNLVSDGISSKEDLLYLACIDKFTPYDIRFIIVSPEPFAHESKVCVGHFIDFETPLFLGAVKVNYVNGN